MVPTQHVVVVVVVVTERVAADGGAAVQQPGPARPPLVPGERQQRPPLQLPAAAATPGRALMGSSTRHHKVENSSSSSSSDDGDGRALGCGAVRCAEGAMGRCSPWGEVQAVGTRPFLRLMSMMSVMVVVVVVVVVRGWRGRRGPRRSTRWQVEWVGERCGGRGTEGTGERGAHGLVETRKTGSKAVCWIAQRVMCRQPTRRGSHVHGFGGCCTNWCEDTRACMYVCVSVQNYFLTVYLALSNTRNE